MSMELYSELQDKLAILETYTKEVGKYGRQFAQAEMEYRIAKAKKILELRDNGFPVTITQDVVMGSPEIARARFKRDCAEVLYKAAFESINTTKLSIKILEAELEREYRG